MPPLDISIQEDNLFNQKVNEKKQTLPESRIINSDLFMYWSKGKKINLNGKELDENGDLIVCRQLAAAQLWGYDKNKSSISYHDAFKKLAEIPFLRKNIFDNKKIRCNADSYQLVNTSNIGQKLAELVLANPPHENKPLLILFYSQNHAMSIKIKFRGELGFVLQFYDPNNTLAHKQIWFPDAESIAKLTLSHLIDEYFQQDYFPKLNGVIATYLDPNFSRPRTPTFHANGISPSRRLYYALIFGQPSAVVAAMQDIFNSDNGKKEAALTAKNAEGAPGLYMALQDGNHETVTAYVTVILESDLDTEQKQSLLTAKRNDGFPGLFMALQYGHHETVTAYVIAILKSNLDTKQKQNLLAAKNAKGTPGLFMALQNGHHETVTAYVTAILESNLDTEQKQNLLAAKSDSGTPGLYMALQDGHHETVTAYVNAILESNLDTKQKQNLLAAKHDDDLPGLSKALQNGHHKTAIAYVTAIQESNLNKEQKQNLLAAKREHRFFSYFYQELISGNLKPASLGHTKKIILDYLKGCLDNKETKINNKIDLLFDAINPNEKIGKILFTSNSRFDFTIFQCTKARLTAGSLNAVMILIKSLNMNLNNEEDKAYLKQKCQGMTNVDHREYVNAFLFENDSSEMLSAPALKA